MPFRIHQVLNRSTLIHSYPHPNPSAPSAITALAQSPAVDVIGVGYADGTIRVYDIKQAELVMQMKMDEGGVTQLSFRMGACWTRCASQLTNRWPTYPRFGFDCWNVCDLGSEQRRALDTCAAGSARAGSDGLAVCAGAAIACDLEWGQQHQGAPQPNLFKLVLMRSNGCSRSSYSH